MNFLKLGYNKEGNVYFFDVGLIMQFSREMMDFYSHLVKKAFYENQKIDVIKNLDFLERCYSKYVRALENNYDFSLPVAYHLWINVLVSPIYQYYNNKNKSRASEYPSYIKLLEKSFEEYVNHKQKFIKVAKRVKEPLLIYLTDFYRELSKDEEAFRKKLNSKGDPMRDIFGYHRDIEEYDIDLNNLNKELNHLREILYVMKHSKVISFFNYVNYSRRIYKLTQKIESIKKRKEALYDLIPTLDDERIVILTSYSRALDYLQTMIYLLGGKINDASPNCDVVKVLNSRDHVEAK